MLLTKHLHRRAAAARPPHLLPALYAQRPVYLRRNASAATPRPGTHFFCFFSSYVAMLAQRHSAQVLSFSPVFLAERKTPKN